MQKLIIELHDEARLCFYVPYCLDNEHASPENSPMGEAQTNEGKHDAFLPFPKRDAVRWIY